MCANKTNARKIIQDKYVPRTHTIEKYTDVLRRRYKEKMKKQRAEEQCKGRQLHDDTVQDVKERFDLAYFDDPSGKLDNEEILQILAEVEQELLQEEAEQQAKEQENETNALLKQFVICSICNKATEFEGNSSTVICTDCAKLHFSDENL